MLTLSPPPLPDETLYSLLCRAYLLDAGFTRRKIMKHTFNPMERASDLEMVGGQFFNFWKTCLQEYWSLEQCIEETTLFRLYAPLLPKSNRKHIKKWVGRNPVSLRMMLEQNFTSESLDLYYLKYCPQCILADVEEHGVPYWHRSHCCKWAFACHRHGCELVKVGFIGSGGECFQLPDYSLGGVSEQRETLIESLIHRWLNEPIMPMLEPKVYKERLGKKISLHYCRALKHAIDLFQKDLDQQLVSTDFFMLEVLFQFPDGTRREWVVEALLSERKLSIAVMLLIRREINKLGHPKLLES